MLKNKFTRELIYRIWQHKLLTQSVNNMSLIVFIHEDGAHYYK